MTKEEKKEYNEQWRKEHPNYQKKYFEDHYIRIDKKKPLFKQVIRIFKKFL